MLELNNTVGLGCQGNKGDGTSMASGGHLYQFYCQITSWAGNTWTNYDETSCRSMTVGLVASTDPTGENSSPGSATLEVEQSTLNAQTFTFPDNELTTETIQLDGSQLQFEYTDTNKWSVLYFINQGTADCDTPTGKS